jgi:hypothetical protein
MRPYFQNNQSKKGPGHGKRKKEKNKNKNKIKSSINSFKKLQQGWCSGSSGKAHA